MNMIFTDATDRIRHWLEAGKQIGKTFSFEKEGKVYWSSVAVQKHEGVYKVYVDEIKEDSMYMSEDYLLELVYVANSFDEAVALFQTTCHVPLTDLAPCKGQKKFNPDLYP